LTRREDSVHSLEEEDWVENIEEKHCEDLRMMLKDIRIREFFEKGGVLGELTIIPPSKTSK